MGEELFSNYGIKDRELPWLKTNAKKAATELQLNNPTPLSSKIFPKKVRVKVDCNYYSETTLIKPPRDQNIIVAIIMR